MERRLYEICRQHSITIVTISHRPALMAYHDTSLAIGDGKQGDDCGCLCAHACAWW